MGNRDLILAGVAAGGVAGNSLGWFGPKGTTLPTDAEEALNAALLDGGWADESGLKKTVQESVTSIKAYGSVSPVRTLITESATAFDYTFLETNPVSLAVYNRLPLDDPDLVPTAAGKMSLVEGPARKQEYAGVFDIVDGLNIIRAVCPLLEVTGRRDFEVRAGAAITYPVTLTAYPGTDGVAVQWLYLVDALAA